MKKAKSGFGRFFLILQNTAYIAYLAAFLLAVFWLFYLHPYHGIRHDSVLYLGQALLVREPQQFAQDLFFAYGSQSKYTFFPELVAWLLNYFRPAEIFLTLTLVGLCAFAAAAFALIRTLFTPEQHFYALLAVLILPAGYGGHLIFSYAEPFFSGRSIAEPLVLATLAAWIANRRWLAAICWLLAASIHPLQALTIPMLAFGVLVWQDKRWWHLLWLAIPMVGLGFWGIAPFDQLVMRHGPEWHSWIAERTPHVFVSSWQYEAWGYWLTDIFLGWLVVQRASGRLQSVMRGAIIATVLGMVATLVFADWLGLVLPTGLQLWRAQWLLHWLAMASVSWLLVAHWRADGGFNPRLALLLAIVVYGVPLGAIAPSPLAILAMIPLYLAWPHLPTTISSWLMRMLRGFAWLTLVLGLAKYGQGVWSIYARMEGVREAMRPEFMLASYPLVAGMLVYAGLLAWERAKRWRIVLIAALLLALAHAVDVWDRRTQWTHYIESAQYSPGLFGVSLEPGSQIFWEDELLASWLILNRPSFMNSQQAAGIAFNRGTAVEVVRRQKILDIFSMQKQICSLLNNLNSNNACAVDDQQIGTLCSNSAGPNYLVLTDRLQTAPQGTWSITGGSKGDRQITYYLYRCADFSSYIKKE